MDRKREALEKLNGRFDARVLEPSPPAVEEPPWLADDPVNSPNGTGPVVAPVTGFDRTWDEVAAAEPDLCDWCADRWLGSWRALKQLPQKLAATRRGLHALAEHIVTPARYRTNGKIGLRYTYGGFGTPFYGDGRQVRVEGGELVVDRGDSEDRAAITTLADAGRFVGVEPGGPEDLYECTTPCHIDMPLGIDTEAVRSLADWFGFAASVLEELRTEATDDESPSRVQLWPEHFDIAIEMGDEEAGKRAGFGASPGDDIHHEPYLYVVPWKEVADEVWWNDTHFNGARFDHSEILKVEDQRACALDFFRTRRDVLRQV